MKHFVPKRTNFVKTCNLNEVVYSTLNINVQNL
jgi:hypothetical protein